MFVTLVWLSKQDFEGLSCLFAAVRYEISYKDSAERGEVSVSATSTLAQLLTEICKQLPFKCDSKDLVVEHQSSDIMDKIEDRTNQLLHLYLRDRSPFSISESVLVINLSVSTKGGKQRWLPYIAF